MVELIIIIKQAPGGVTMQCLEKSGNLPSFPEIEMRSRVLDKLNEIAAEIPGTSNLLGN